MTNPLNFEALCIELWIRLLSNCFRVVFIPIADWLSKETSALELE